MYYNTGVGEVNKPKFFTYFSHNCSTMDYGGQVIPPVYLCEVQ